MSSVRGRRSGTSADGRRHTGRAPRVQTRSGDIALRDVTLTSGDQTLTVQGRVSPPREAQTIAGTLEVHATNVDLAQLERLLLMNRGLGGRLTANAVITGTTSLPIVDGHVEVVDGRFQGYADHM